MLSDLQSAATDRMRRRLAVDGHGLYLAYGSTAETEAGALAIAREVVATLENVGLSTLWDGTWASCIHVKIDWKRRREGQTA